MTKLSIIIFLFLSLFSTNIAAYKIPKNGEVHFDIIRKGKDIGDHIINFNQKNDQLIVTVEINIKVKIAFVVVYRFEHKSKEIWVNKSLNSLSGKTLFEDEREYDVSIKDLGEMYEGSGMDGRFQFSKTILPSNYWNINIMNEKKIFDTQKGIVRNTFVENLGLVELEIDGKKLEAHKYILNADKHSKDKGPFSETTIWYDKNYELIQFSFNSTKDDSLITIVRKDI